MCKKLQNKRVMSIICGDRSQISGTGPTGYGTGPRLLNNFGPVPDQRLQRKLNSNPFILQKIRPKCSEIVFRGIIWDWSHGISVNLNHFFSWLNIK